MNQQTMIWPSEIARYAHLFAKMRDPVLILNAETFRILDANPFAESFLSATREALCAKNLADFVPEAQSEELLKALRISRRRYFPIALHSRWVTPEGEKEMELSLCSLQLSEEQEVIQVIGKDITRIVQAEAESRRYLERLQELSTTDEMTGLFNYRRFRELHEQELNRSKRFKMNYSLVFCDLDHFKQYNDTYGHPAGDKLLRSVAQLIRSTCRKVDQAFRYGGEEFVILCPQTNCDQAMALANRIRQVLKESGLGVTISLGIASYPENGTRTDDVLKAADVAVYRAKQDGRDRAVVFGTND